MDGIVIEIAVAERNPRVNSPFDEMTESPCKRCQWHKKGVPPEECKGVYEGCFFGSFRNNYSMPNTNHIREILIEKLGPTGVCYFPGCKIKCKGLFCQKHWQTVHRRVSSYRRKHGVNPDVDYILAPKKKYTVRDITKVRYCQHCGKPIEKMEGELDSNYSRRKLCEEHRFVNLKGVKKKVKNDEN